MTGSRPSQDVVWEPHAGPQTTFLMSDAYEALYGGAAGGGKSDSLLFGALRQTGHSQYRALIIRRTFPELQYLIDRSMATFPMIGGQWIASEKRWKFPSGAIVEFGYCETYSDVQQYQGRQFDYIGVDELGQIADERVWTYLMSRNRASGPGLIRMMRGSANPGGPGHQWIKKRFIDTCPRSGETTRVESVLFDGTKTATTRAFVFARLEDNPTLLENDPTYGERLKQLTETEYRWLGLGDWDAGGGSFYPELGEWQRLLIPASQTPALLDWYEYWASYDWGFVHPASFTQFCRIKDTVYVLDTMSMHRYQDEEQASAIKSASEGRCLRLVFAGHDAFAKRMAHSAAAETVADVFGRYSINLEKANIDREAGAKVLRRFFAKPKPGPQPKGAMKLVVVDTVGNRAALMELAALIPEATRPNVPAKRDADEKGLNGDDLADGWRYGLATPSFEPMEPLPVWKEGNVDTGVDGKPPWEQTFTKTTDTGQIDKRPFIFRPEGPDGDFPEEMT